MSDLVFTENWIVILNANPDYNRESPDYPELMKLHFEFIDQQVGSTSSMVSYLRKRWTVCLRTKDLFKVVYFSLIWEKATSLMVTLCSQSSNGRGWKSFTRPVDQIRPSIQSYGCWQELNLTWTRSQSREYLERRYWLWDWIPDLDLQSPWRDDHR